MLEQFRLSEVARKYASVKLATLTAGAAANGVAVDTAGYKNALVEVLVGTIGSTGIVDAKVQESDDGSSGWTDVTNASITSLPDTADDAIRLIDLNLSGAKKKFLRVVITPTNANVIAGGFITLYRPDGMATSYPIAQEAAVRYA